MRYLITFFAVFMLIFLFGCQSTYISAGKIYLDKYDYDAALDQFKKAVKSEPNNPDAYIWLGKAYAYRNSYESACKATEKALDLNPTKLNVLKKDKNVNYWSVFYNAGVKHVNNKKYELSIKRIIRSLEFEPENSKSMNLLAYSYVKLKMYDDAERIYKNALKFVRRDINTYINLANFYIERGKFQEAEKILVEANEIVENPDWLAVVDQKIVEDREKASAKVSELLTQCDRAKKEKEEAKRKEEKTWRAKIIKEKGIIEFVNYRIEHWHEDFSRDATPYRAHVRAYFQFRNNSDKILTGLKYDVKFLDSFEEILYKTSIKDQIKVTPGEINYMDHYWYWKDNPFIAGEPYDKLWSAASAGTIKVKIKLKQAVFVDGSKIELPKKWIEMK